MFAKMRAVSTVVYVVAGVGHAVLIQACGASSSTPRAETGVVSDASPDAEVARNDATACTESESIAAARATLSAGAQSAFLDCAHTFQYTRKLADNGTVAVEEIVDTVRHRRAIWDFRGPTKTYRAFASPDATLATHAIDATMTASSGSVTYISTDDTDGNNVPDRRVTWTVDPSSSTIPVTVETDPAETGAWAVSFTTTAVANQPKLRVDTSGVGPGACSPDQEHAIRDAYRNALDIGTACLKDLDSDLGLRFYEFIVNDSDVSIDCAETEVCGRARLQSAVTHWFPSLSGPNELAIGVSPADFATCRLDSTLFHELLHFLLGPHIVGDGYQDPADQVYNCERTCFGGLDVQNSLTCAGCLGTRNGDPRCASYRQVPCEGAHPVYCPCDDVWYETLGECTALCKCSDGSSCEAATGGPCEPVSIGDSPQVSIGLSCSGPYDEPWGDTVSVSVVNECVYWRTAQYVVIVLQNPPPINRPDYNEIAVSIAHFSGPGTYETDNEGTTEIAVLGGNQLAADSSGSTSYDVTPATPCTVVVDSNLNQVEIPPGGRNTGWVSVDVTCPQLGTTGHGPAVCTVSPSTFHFRVGACEAVLGGT